MLTSTVMISSYEKTPNLSPLQVTCAFQIPTLKFACRRKDFVYNEEERIASESYIERVGNTVHKLMVSGIIRCAGYRFTSPM